MYERGEDYMPKLEKEWRVYKGWPSKILSMRAFIGSKSWQLKDYNDLNQVEESFLRQKFCI